MSHQLPDAYDEFLELAVVNDHQDARDLSIAVDLARHFTGVGECAFGAVSECACCARLIVNIEPYAIAVTAHYLLNQKQHDDLRARLENYRVLNATGNGICGRCQ